MEQYWKPVEKPPHPSEIRSISPFCESILQTLRCRSYEREEMLRRVRPIPVSRWEQNSILPFRDFPELEQELEENCTAPYENLQTEDFFITNTQMPQANLQDKTIVKSFKNQGNLSRPQKMNNIKTVYSKSKPSVKKTVLPFFGSQPPPQPNIINTNLESERKRIDDRKIEERNYVVSDSVTENLFESEGDSQFLKAIKTLEQQQIVQKIVEKQVVEAAIPKILQTFQETTAVVEDGTTSRNAKSAIVVLNKEQQTPKENPNKRKKFSAPFLNKKFIQTKLVEPKIIQVVEINKRSLMDMENQILNNPPLEICMSILHGGGVIRLAEPENSGSTKAILLRIKWQENNVEYCRISSELFKSDKINVGNFFRSALGTKTTIICVEAVEVMVYFIHKFKFERDVALEWAMMDPLVAYWLLESDHPCCNFLSLVDVLKIEKTSLNNYGDVDTKCCKYLDLLSKTFQVLKEKLLEENLWRIFLDIEVKLTPILAMMTQRGIKVDVTSLNNIGKTIGHRLNELETEAQKLAGQPFAFNSPHQLRLILFDHLKLDKLINLQVKGTAMLGVKSTSEAVLRQLSAAHPLPGVVLEYRRLHKLKSTSIDGIVALVKKGVVNTIWEQRTTATGRLASSNPNLQSIPKNWFTVNKEDEQSFNIRSAFQPRLGYIFILADFQQIEFRIFAELTQDPGLIQIFQQSGDVFVTLAEKWLGKIGAAVDEADREKTKRIVYALMYGAGPSKLAEFLNVTLQEASSIFNSFCETFPIMKKFTKLVSEKCFKEEVLRTMQGRVRKFPNIKSTTARNKAQAERQALNFLIQGAAADMCKRAMLLTEKAFLEEQPPVNAHLLLQIHDELVWEVAETNADRVKDLVRSIMENSKALTGSQYEMIVPIQVKIQQQFSLASLQ